MTANPFADHPLLEAMLPVAMLYAVDEVGRLSIEERLRLASECSQVVAEHGDDLMYGSKRKGATARAFAGFVRGLAALAHQPGGVTFGGLHWCVGSNHRGTREPAPCAAELAREAAGEGSPR
jgi:hypothetical protein